MANNIAFQATGNTFAIVTTTANTAVNKPVTGVTPSNQYKVTSANTTAFVRLSESNANAVLPTGTTSQPGIWLANGESAVITAQQTSVDKTIYVSVISADANGIVFVTPGEGMS
jgi:hypothetical protein